MKIHLLKISKQSGFTLAETLVSLMVFATVILTIEIILCSVHQNNNQSVTTQFYSYLDVLESQKYKLKLCGSKRLTLTKGHRIYYVYFRSHQLIMSTRRGGYMLLMDNIKNTNWSNNRGIVTQHVTMLDGKQFEGKSRFNG